MVELQNVTIQVKQESTVIATLQTDSNGNASTTLNAGVYTLVFNYPSRNSVTTTITLAAANTALCFAFPNLPGSAASPTSALSLFQETNDMASTVGKSSSVTFVNT